jgi:hypothetical protein
VYDAQEYIDQLLGIYKTNSDFDIQAVEGGHHVHLTNPERVLPVIDNFIRNNKL